MLDVIKKTRTKSKKRIRLVEDVMSNEDLLLHILLRLPVKSLIRFKCVSKHWLFLISDPKFCSKYTRLNDTLGFYFMYKGLRGFGLKAVSLQAKRKDLPMLSFLNKNLTGFSTNMPKIFHACNGFFLCSYSYREPYFVCNFTTRKGTTLPQHLLPACGYYHKSGHSSYLVFDPSKSPHFKVVLLYISDISHETIFHHHSENIEHTGYCGSYCYEIDVYSSDSGVWKRFYFRKPYEDIIHHGFYPDYKAVCSGSLHWITTNNYRVRFEVDTTKLLFNLMPTDRMTMEHESIRYFGECCGRLFLVHVPWSYAKPFDVLELHKDQSIWVKKYRVKMSLLIASFPDSFDYLDPCRRHGSLTKKWYFSVLCVVKEDEINGFSLVLAIPGKIVLYNLKRNTLKVLHELPMEEFPKGSWYNFSQTFPFVATICPT